MKHFGWFCRHNNVDLLIGVGTVEGWLELAWNCIPVLYTWHVASIEF